ncbi:hypothetical protein H8N00_26555 [Streptomyces sp. AC563]|uniref:hypothetical protein n=1 Tax=Streptomyces buecherae TaxID=2763006 RepID=UPI00164DBF08|nr:hypothetical protein [Streptomyces buecherae]MBC3992375.1 hypothetical protein [Streptomyces buecherae]
MPDLFVRARLMGSATQDVGKVTSDFGKQVPAVKAPAIVHHEHRRGDDDHGDESAM